MTITNVENRHRHDGRQYSNITIRCDGPGCEDTVLLNSLAPSDDYGAWATILGFTPQTDEDAEHPDLGNVHLCSLRCLKAWAQEL